MYVYKIEKVDCCGGCNFSETLPAQRCLCDLHRGFSVLSLALHQDEGSVLLSELQQVRCGSGGGHRRSMGVGCDCRMADFKPGKGQQIPWRPTCIVDLGIVPGKSSKHCISTLLIRASTQLVGFSQTEQLLVFATVLGQHNVWLDPRRVPSAGWEFGFEVRHAWVLMQVPLSSSVIKDKLPGPQIISM